MTILITGGPGKTGLRLAQHLQNAKIPFLFASRRGQPAAPSGMQAVKFDFLDESTYENPFGHEVHDKDAISAVYLIAPQSATVTPSMNAFIDFAVERGVKRFVLVASIVVEQGMDYGVGMVWQHLIDLGVECCVLRPSWFMENFSEWQHPASIRSEGKIYTAAGDSKIAFISAEDIAEVAFRALTDDKTHEPYYNMVGPELLTHDEAAVKLSNGLGRQITHIKQSQEERVQGLMENGQPESVARMLAWLEYDTTRRAADPVDDAVQRVTGRAATSFDEFVRDNRTAWG